MRGWCGRREWCDGECWRPKTRHFFPDVFACRRDLTHACQHLHRSFYEKPQRPANLLQQQRHGGMTASSGVVCGGGRQRRGLDAAASRWPPLLLVALAASSALISPAAALLDPRPGSSVDWWSSGSREQQQQQQQRGGGGGKHAQGPRQALTGGSGLDNNRVAWCNAPSLPGCQDCPEPARGCSTCWFQFPDAAGSSFVLNPTTKQCDCAPGYGLLPAPEPPVWSGPSRHLLLLQQQLAAANISTVSGSSNSSWSSSGNGGSSDAVAHLFSQAVAAHGWAPADALLPPPQQALLPGWVANCLPCPVDHYSPGGQQGFARCLPCPGAFTTAGATAAANCMVPYCGPGQQPTRTSGRCRPCPFGTYNGATASNQACAPCPANYTTPATGSTSYRDCRVPICRPGQYLDIDLFVCRNCTGNTISRGGTRANGPFQPGCSECPQGLVANGTRAVCYAGACPYPTNFGITCTKQNFTCGPGDKALSINQLCTAYPAGSQLVVQAARAWLTLPAATASTASNALEAASTPSASLASAAIQCPAGAYSSPSYAFNTAIPQFKPVIVSFNGRTDCACSCSVFCAFGSTAAQSLLPSAEASSTDCQAPSVYVTDPQTTSLQVLVSSMTGSNYTSNRPDMYYLGDTLAGTSAGYCAPQPRVIRAVNFRPYILPNGDVGYVGSQLNYVNPLQVNCTKQAFISRVALTPGTTWPWTANGVLPPARSLGGLSQLNMLVCDGCGLDGTLPRDWGTSRSLQELRYLNLPGNTFTGTLPETWGYLVNLVNLTLSSSSSAFAGTIPSGWGNMHSLAFVNLTGLSLDDAACAPPAWRERNGLVLNETLLMPSGTQGFC